MEIINKYEKKTQDQRKKENAKYIKNLKKQSLKKEKGFMHLVGLISKETADKMLQHVNDERNNW